MHMHMGPVSFSKTMAAFLPKCYFPPICGFGRRTNINNKSVHLTCLKSVPESQERTVSAHSNRFLSLCGVFASVLGKKVKLEQTNSSLTSSSHYFLAIAPKMSERNHKFSVLFSTLRFRFLKNDFRKTQI